MFTSKFLDKLDGRTPELALIGRHTVLTDDEEQVLVNYIKFMSSIGYPLTRMDLRQEVQKVIRRDGRKNPFKDGLPGNYISLTEVGGYYGFGPVRPPPLSPRP